MGQIKIKINKKDPNKISICANGIEGPYCSEKINELSKSIGIKITNRQKTQEYYIDSIPKLKETT
jgi:hypothetical protein